MKKQAAFTEKAASSPLFPAKTEKGSHRSMWELLLQLRVLLPHLTRLVPLLEPLLDRGASLKTPGFSELTSGLAAVQTGARGLEVQARSQALQLEKIEQQISRLGAAYESSIEDHRRLASEVRIFRRWLIIMAGAILVLLLGIAAMVAFLLLHS